MARVNTSHLVTAAERDELLAPRDDLVAERAVGDRRFEAVEGPFSSYVRHVDVTQVDDDRWQVEETTDFRLAVPFWRVVFTPLTRRALRRRRPPGSQPWWAPPDRLDPRAATVLGLLATLALFGGYLGTLITQTITFAADEFDAGDTAQGVTLAVVRIGVLLALVLVAAADRRGRRRLLVIAATGACLVAVTGAVSPNMVWLGASQTVARGLSTALALLVGIVAAEEMPRSSRAYAVSLLAMTAALGAGMAVWALPLADLGPGGWRLLYLIPLLAVPAVLAIGRRLPESKRFVVAHERPPASGRSGRLALLAVSGFLVSMFVAPASQFQNEFLRTERDFSASRITLFTLSTNTPGGIGVLVGGHLADVRGRKLVGSVALAGGAVLTVAMYLSVGWPLWAWSAIGAIVGAATIPALGVYGPELFPTTARGRLNGTITLIGVAGSSIGLLVAGVLSDQLGGFGPTMALLAVGPLLVALLVATVYPETAHRRLEEINPEDAPVEPSGGDGSRAGPAR